MSPRRRSIREPAVVGRTEEFGSFYVRKAEPGKGLREGQRLKSLDVDSGDPGPPRGAWGRGDVDSGDPEQRGGRGRSVSQGRWEPSPGNTCACGAPGPRRCLPPKGWPRSHLLHGALVASREFFLCCSPAFGPLSSWPWPPFLKREGDQSTVGARWHRQRRRKGTPRCWAVLCHLPVWVASSMIR